MTILLTIIVFVLVFSLLILVHELGHFAAAKKSGVKVEEFGIGIPPRIWGVKKGETLYSINWIPFGGFVKMLGDTADGKKVSKSKRSFDNQPIRAKMLIICAGVLMNFLLAFILLTFGFLVGIEPLIASEEEFLNAVRDGQVVLEVADEEAEESFYLPRLKYLEDENSVLHGVFQNGDVVLAVNGVEILTKGDFFDALSERVSPVEIELYRSSTKSLASARLTGIGGATDTIVSYVEAGSPAEVAGLQVGDLVLKIGGDVVGSAEDVAEATANNVENGKISYELMRDGKRIYLNIPVREEDGRVGISVSDMIPVFDNFSLYQSYTAHELVETKKVQYGLMAPFVAVQEMWRLGKLTAVMFVDVFAGFLSGSEVPDGVAGPVGIAQMTFVNMQDGFAAMLRFVALLSLSLGVVNILPIPALDGGRAVFIIYHAVTGRKPNPHFEQWIHTVGFFLLLLFLVYVTFNDVLSLF
jgi:regulator of sigma E protease